MFLSGIADEASPKLDRQIQAHRELGWRHIEMRNVEGKNLTDLPDREFDAAAGAIEEAGLQVSCFASQLGNWSRPIATDFRVDVEELRRALPRMARLRTPFIRCMSYPNATPPWPEADWRREAVRRLRELARMAEEGGVTLVHENCSGWGGKGPGETMDLLAEVGSPALRLVFDTGNPAQYGQDAWEYYRRVRDAVAYVHVKDYRRAPGAKEQAVYAGEGDCAVREIIRDLLERGYDGGFSIEPHITSVIHLRQEATDPELAYSTYVEYGRRFQALLEEISGRAVPQNPRRYR
ncbi:MAG: sugar phosphate isomerase/epimerase family protein [Planctomycetota bacterium]